MFDFKKKENLIKIGAGLLIVISWAVLIGWKIKNPDINLRNPLIIAGIITVLSIVAFFSQKLFKRGFKSEEDVPEPLSQEEVERKIRKEFEDKFWSHIKINDNIKKSNKKFTEVSSSARDNTRKKGDDAYDELLEEAYHEQGWAHN